MNKRIKILILGCKEWPYGISAQYEKYPGGGTARYIEIFVKSLLKLSYSIIIITRHFPGQLKYEKIGELEIYRVPFINSKLLRLPSFNFLSMIKGIKLKDIDLIHAHTIFAIYWGYWLSRIMKRPIVGTPHGTVANQWKGILRFIAKLIEKNIYSKLKKVVFYNEYDLKKFEKICKINFLNATIIPAGINFQTKNIKKMENEKLNILYFGRLVTVKRVDNLIKSINYIPIDSREKIQLIIIGDGYEKERLINLTHKEKLDGIVQILGFQPDLENFLMTSDIFVLPSDSEGFPISLLEAMSYGLACIVNDLKLSINKKSVLVIKNNDPESIANAINYLVINPKERDRLSKNSIEEVKNSYSFDSITIKHDLLYKKILGV